LISKLAGLTAQQREEKIPWPKKFSSDLALTLSRAGSAPTAARISTLRADPVLRHHFRAAGVVATVDAVNGLGQLDRYVESMRQAAIADVIALTKTDIADEERIAPLVGRLRAINPTAPLLRVAEGPPPAGVLLSAGAGSFKAVAAVEGPAAHVRRALSRLPRMNHSTGAPWASG
jgi:G3E family GTPase